MGDRDDHHVVFTRELATVVEGGVARTGPESPAVEPDHHRAGGTAFGPRRPYIETKTVFVHRSPSDQRVANLGNHRSERLRRSGAVFVGFDNPSPGCWAGRGHESSFTCRRQSVSDPLESRDAALEETANFPGRGFDDGAFGRVSSLGLEMRHRSGEHGVHRQRAGQFEERSAVHVPCRFRSETKYHGHRRPAFCATGFDARAGEALAGATPADVARGFFRRS